MGFIFYFLGHVYLCKVGVARQVVKRKFVDCFRRKKDTGPGSWAQVAEAAEEETELDP